MSPLQVAIFFLTSTLVTTSPDNWNRKLNFLTAKLEGVTTGDEQRSQRTTHLYKAPSPYQSPGRPVLNSYIVTSRPLDLHKETQRRVDEYRPSEQIDGYRYLPQYKIECDSRRGSCSETITVPPTTTDPPTFKPYTPDMIDRFMKDLEKDDKRVEGSFRNEQGVKTEGDGQQISKGSKATHWYRPSPYWPPDDEKKGWVALDPVPWSSSKISKWTADKNNPNGRPPETTRRPWTSSPSHHTPSPTHGLGSYSWHGPNKPPRPHDSYQNLPSEMIITDGKDPEWPSTHSQYRPTHRPDHWQDKYRPNYRPDHNSDHIEDYHGINNRPQSWESNHHNERPIHRRPQHYPTPVVYHDSPVDKSHSFAEESGGQWVVFSDTKEYKPVSDRRSFGRSVGSRAKSLAKSVSGRRKVRLTVLPSEGNMTTSHGGMLEVDASSDTVDEDVRKRRQLALENRTVNEVNGPKPATVIFRNSASSDIQRTGVDRARALVAAVGAGMVPATMAAVLPFMLAQRKRRSIQFPPYSAKMKPQNVDDRWMHVKAF